MNSKIQRRDFIRITSAAGAGMLAEGGRGRASESAAPSSLPVVISSANGVKATAKAMEILKAGGKPLDAVIAGVNIVEEDPADTSVGYGGLPNDEGEIELDASVMNGLTYRCGAAGGAQIHQTPSRVARLVMECTDHMFLVG